MKLYVIVVNYNGWQDTIECLDTVLRSDYPDFRVVVCDNGSVDGSLERIAAWAEGRLALPPVANPLLRRLHEPARRGALRYARYGRDHAERGGEVADAAPLVLVDCGANLGFAGGNNVGLRYALARGDCALAWLLNNDTVVEPDAMRRMAERLMESESKGLCGSTLLHYHDARRIQALGGGWYCKWIGLPWHLGRLRRWTGTARRERVERMMNYPVGASMMATRAFLDGVGLLGEDYFLYFEELDWVLRGVGRFGLAYAPGSIVYHKIGKSIGTSSRPGRKSVACDYYNVRNRILFTRRFFPCALPSVYLMLAGTLLTRILLGKWDRALMVANLMLGRAPALPGAGPAGVPEK